MFAGSARYTVRLPSDCFDISLISDSKPILTASRPFSSSKMHNCSAIPQPSSVTTTVPEISSSLAIPKHSSTSTCHRLQPLISLLCLVDCCSVDASDDSKTGSAVCESDTFSASAPLILTIYAAK